MTANRSFIFCLLAACSTGSLEDTVESSCDEVAREPYTDAGSALGAALQSYVAMYQELDGVWLADIACVGGDNGEVEVTLATASTSDMEVATYDGEACGDVSEGVVADTSAVVGSEMVDVSGVVLETTILDGDAWGVVTMSGEASDGTSVLIEMASDGELRGSTASSEVTGSDQETLECEITNWRR